MSGQKDVVVQAIDPALLEQQRRAQEELERKQREIAAHQARIDAQLGAVQSRLQQATETSDRLRQQINENTTRLEEIVSQRREIKRKLQGMKQQTLDTQKEAHRVSKDIADDMEKLNKQLEGLKSLEQSLTGELARTNQLLAKHDGSEAIAAAQEFTRLSHEQSRLATEAGVIQGQIAAYAANSALGTVIHNLLEASTDLGYSISRVFSSASEVEFFITNIQNETIRIAADLSKKMPEQMTDDERLQLVLHGEGHATDEVCITDTIKLLERLRERGVAVTIRVDSPETAKMPETLGRQSSREKERG